MGTAEQQVRTRAHGPTPLEYAFVLGVVVAVVVAAVVLLSGGVRETLTSLTGLL